MLPEDEDLPDFPSDCWFLPCRCSADISALLGRDEEFCREIEALQAENEELRARLEVRR